MHRLYHPTWINLMEKCRERVTDEVTRDLCSRAQNDAVFLRRTIKRKDELGQEKVIESGADSDLCKTVELAKKHF